MGERKLPDLDYSGWEPSTRTTVAACATAVAAMVALALTTSGCDLNGAVYVPNKPDVKNSAGDVPEVQGSSHGQIMEIFPQDPLVGEDEAITSPDGS